MSRLNGNIQSYSETRYLFSESHQPLPKFLIKEKEFFDKDDSFLKREDFDEKEILIKTYYFDNSYETKNRFYNEKGQLTEVESNNGHRVTYLYDDLGNKIQESVFDERRIWKVFKFEYDSKNNCISEVLNYVPGSADEPFLENAYVIKRIYNDLNLVIEEKKNSNTTKYVYNNKGKLVESLEIRKEDWNKEFRITSKFNSDKQIIESQEYDLHKGKVTEIIMFDYDEHKNLISETNYDGNNKVIKVSRYSYQYDEHNNWIKKISEEYCDEIKFPDFYQIFLRDIKYNETE